MKKHFIFTVIGLGIFGLTGCNADDSSLEKKQREVKEVSTQSEEKKEPTYQVSGVSFTKPEGLKTGVVISVVDGDTIKVLVEGKEETVQMMTIDTPEIIDESGVKQYYGAEAAQFAKDNLETKNIELDLGDARNDNNELEAQIWIENTLYNALAVNQGYARINKNSTNKKLIVPLQGLEEAIKKSKVGIWSVDGYATDTGFNMTVINKVEEKPGTFPEWGSLTMSGWVKLTPEEKLYVVEMSINLEIVEQNAKNSAVEIRGTLEEFVKVIDDRYTEINSSKDPYEKLRMMGSLVSAQVSIMGHQKNLIEFVYNR